MSNENQVHTIENFTKEVQNLDTFSLANKMLIMSKALIDCNGKDKKTLFTSYLMSFIIEFWLLKCLKKWIKK